MALWSLADSLYSIGQVALAVQEVEDHVHGLQHVVHGGEQHVYCLTLTLTGLEGIGAVSVTSQGRAMGQQPRQVFYERDVLLSSAISPLDGRQHSPPG